MFSVIVKSFVTLGSPSFQALFRMDAVPFLFEDQDFKDEPLSGKTEDPEDYNYLSHIYTWNFPEVKTVLADFTEAVHLNTLGEGVVMLEALSEDLTTEDMMGFYSCSDFPFNFNLIVNLPAEDLSGKLKLQKEK